MHQGDTAQPQPLLPCPALLQGVYLGFNHLRPFDQQALYDLWTDVNSTSVVDFSDITQSMTTDRTSLWQLGNDFITAGR